MDDPWSHPVWTVAWMTYTDVLTSYCPREPELWVNPGDWEAAGRPAQFMGLPVRRSLGVPAGSVRIFDRETLRYLPVARPGSFRP